MRGESGRQKLHGHVTFDAGIARAVYLTHAAGTEKPNNFVVPEDSPEHRSGAAFSKSRRCHLQSRSFQESIRLVLASEQGFHFAAHVFVRTGFPKKPISVAGLTIARSMIELLDLTPLFSLHPDFRC
jgi:hypothetical protein